MSDPTTDGTICPRCQTATPADASTVDVYACTCEELVFFRPFGEWFVRLKAIVKVSETFTTEEVATIVAAQKRSKN